MLPGGRYQLATKWEVLFAITFTQIDSTWVVFQFCNRHMRNVLMDEQHDPATIAISAFSIYTIWASFREEFWSCNRTVDFVCLCWGLTSQSTIFQSYRDGATASWVINQYFREVKCLAQGHNMTAVGFEPRPLAPESDTLPLSHRAPPVDFGFLDIYNMWLMKVKGSQQFQFFASMLLIFMLMSFNLLKIRGSFNRFYVYPTHNFKRVVSLPHQRSAREHRFYENVRLLSNLKLRQTGFSIN